MRKMFAGRVSAIMPINDKSDRNSFVKVDRLDDADFLEGAPRMLTTEAHRA